MYRMVDGIDGHASPPKRQRYPHGVHHHGISAPQRLEETGRKQDYAMGDGFFALYDPDTGEISLYLDGSFALSSFQQTKEDGTTDTLYSLADGEGRQVLDTNGELHCGVSDAEARQPGRVYHSYLDGLQHAGQRPVCDHREKRCGGG